jgi:MFS family permease
MRDYGVVPVEAASVLAMMGAFDLVGTTGSGWLSDRFDNRWLLLWYYGLRGLSLLYLPFTTFNLYGLSLFAVFYGLDWIATVPPTLRLTIERFGRAKANVVFGWIFAGHQLGAASAAFGAGLSRTVLGSYLPAFFTLGGDMHSCRGPRDYDPKKSEARNYGGLDDDCGRDNFETHSTRLQAARADGATFWPRYSHDDCGAAHDRSWSD